LRLGAGGGRRDELGQRLEQLNLIGASLSAERDINRLLELILAAAKSITGADGGTLYRVTEDKTLRFEIVRTSSLKYYLGGASGNPFSYPIQPTATASPTTTWRRRRPHRQDGTSPTPPRRFLDFTGTP
jgi:GAF domain-containing protein